MFFGFDPAQITRAFRPPQPQQQNGNQGGIFGGFANFLNNNFMNPFYDNRPPHPQEEEQAPRPTFSRMGKKESHK